MENYSVLMSVYKNDNPDYLKESIESMLNQTVLCNQFILVEDGPVSCEIEKTINHYEARYPSIFTIIRLPQNKGLGNALNEGLKHSKNELVCRMDADDISEPFRCEKQLNEFQNNSDLCVVGTQIKEFIGTPSNIVSIRKVPCNYDEIKQFAKRRSPFNHPTVMYKKSVIESVGGYPVLSRKEDLFLFLNIVFSDYYVKNLPECMLFYRTSKENQARRKTWVNCRESIAVMYRFYKNKKIGIFDFLYVLFGQMAMFVLPDKISDLLTKLFLRKPYNEKNEN